MNKRSQKPHPDQYELDFGKSAKPAPVPLFKPANDNFVGFADYERDYVSAETNWNALQSSLRQVVAISEMSCCIENAWALSDALSIVNDLVEEINCDFRAANDCD